MSYSRLSLLVLLLGSLTACTQGVRPDDMSAQKHEAAAAKEERAAETHEKFVQAMGPYNVRYKSQHEANAESARRHAEMHRAAAEALRTSEAKECAGVTDADRAECPLIHVERAEDKADGVVLWLAAGSSPEGVAQQMRCHIAFASTRGREGMDGCPFFVKGISVAAVPGQNAVKLSAPDPKSVQEIQQQVHTMAQ